MTPKGRPRVLAIDDEPAMTEWLTALLESAGYDVRSAQLGARTEELFKTWQPAAVLTDLRLPDIDGIELVRLFTRLDADVPVIVLTGQGDIPRSVEAVKAGAFDFLEKPVDPAHLLNRLENAITRKALIDANAELTRRLRGRDRFQHLIGTSEQMRRLFELVDAVATSDANVLIQGENGTGKELIANAIHENSPRAKGPFIKINCAAIPPDLIESELFGYTKGAFTGATTNKAGLIEQATGGSLLLDEIGEMPPALQTKLLRLLQEREYRPVGSDRVVRADFRLICATNVDIDVALRDGKIREDLYFRINTIALRVPPLRERAEDLPLLYVHFLEKFARQYQKSLKGVERDVALQLARHRWPGNVRELENAIEHAVVVAKGTEITVMDLPDAVRRAAPKTTNFVIPPDRTLADIEKMAILEALERTNWNKMETARVLGLYRPTLYSKIKKYQLREPGRSSAEPQPVQDVA